MSKLFFTLCLYLSSVYVAKAQQPDTLSASQNRFSILFGLNQPIVLRGFNFEVNYSTNKWIFDYSHGIGLHVDGNTLGDSYEKQQLDFRISHSAGFGIGYRLTESFNIRFEPKVHFYETYYTGDAQKSPNSLADFTTYTLGIGAYYNWLPFENRENWLKGITVVPSVRYWQKIDSTLPNNEFSYFNTRTNATERFKAPNIGIANSPVVLNISVGYSF
ncbi:hypothetical protein [Flavobacterium silvaticum]|uniref:Outer membrane protein beta-barrel domain-containing protein n=1 Tax=Flavobacterium silvaticum TaxID=1852020 RepID=A0A972JIM1_9FLAO|nr:hypothetical protein [Flavobacterium silvaticum]NMH29190.1 hypothetical protein [Flavobacterium silvaticum]